jgi:DNA-binding transcriptional LysR family regulator
MEIRQLKYFIAVAEELNISRAAARLHISQPPLTRHIKALEDSLGVQLFNRSNWGVELTQAGTLLLEHARSIKSHVEFAAQQARQVSQGLLGRIAIGIYGSALLDLIPKLLNRFKADHPGVEVTLLNVPKAKQIEALHQGRLLIAFDRNLPESDEIAVELVDREPVIVALHAEHPLARQQSVHLEELVGQDFVGELEPSTFPGLAEAFQRHHFQPHITQRAADMISATAMVAAGFGASIVPASMRNLHLPNVQYLPLILESEVFVELHCAYRRSETNPLLMEMLDTVRAHRNQQD